MLTKMKNLTKVGIMILVIGVSFFAGTIYRSHSTYGYGTRSLFGLTSNSWSFNATYTSSGFKCFFAPREYRIEVKSNATLDVYLLDADGVTLWLSECSLVPVWSVNEVKQDIYIADLTKRCDYTLLVYNPTNSTADYEIQFTVYGFEKDLFLVSIILISTGLLVIFIALLISQKHKNY
jgi:hypothetical protein